MDGWSGRHWDSLYIQQWEVLEDLKWVQAALYPIIAIATPHCGINRLISTI